MAEPLRLEEARARVLAAVVPLPAETVPLDRAHGRVLAEDVTSDLDVPPFDCSAMDGFAVPRGGPGELKVVGEARAGRPYNGELTPGLAVRISTGAMVPRGADGVVPIERVEAEHDGVVRVPEHATGANIRRAGEDIQNGRPVLAAGSDLGPAQVGVLASLGRASVSCAQRPRAAVVVTGDELADPGEPLGPGQIYSSNAYALAAQVARAGAEVVDWRHVGDDPSATRAAIDAALSKADAVCISGGVSVGPHDHVKRALAALGVEEVFWGVRLKPGKPAWFGRRESKLVFGLPGNPVSAVVTFHLLARPALRALQGAPQTARRAAVLAEPLPRDARREQAVRVRLAHGEDGVLRARSTGAQGSHVLTSLLAADALALVPPGEGELAAGERVEVDPL